MNGFSSELEFRIAQRAYELFLLRGARPGQEVEDWLIAESEILGTSPVSAEVAVEVPVVAEAEVAAVRATAAAKPKAKRAKSVATAAGATTPVAAPAAKKRKKTEKEA